MVFFRLGLKGEREGPRIRGLQVEPVNPRQTLTSENIVSGDGPPSPLGGAFSPCWAASIQQKTRDEPRI